IPDLCALGAGTAAGCGGQTGANSGHRAAVCGAGRATVGNDAGRDIERDIAGRRGGQWIRSAGVGRVGEDATSQRGLKPMALPQIGLPSGLRIYLALEPVDMRKQYDGLWALAAQHLGLDPKGGALFVFTNKTRNRIKLL